METSRQEKVRGLDINLSVLLLGEGLCFSSNMKEAETVTLSRNQVNKGIKINT